MVWIFFQGQETRIHLSIQNLCKRLMVTTGAEPAATGTCSSRRLKQHGIGRRGNCKQHCICSSKQRDLVLFSHDDINSCGGSSKWLLACPQPARVRDTCSSCLHTQSESRTVCKTRLASKSCGAVQHDHAVLPTHVASKGLQHM